MSSGGSGSPYPPQPLVEKPPFLFVQLRLSWNFPRGTFSQKLREPKKHKGIRKNPQPSMPLEGRFPLWSERRPKLGEDSGISSLISNLNRGPAHEDPSLGPLVSFLPSLLLPPGPPMKPCLRLGLGEGVFSGHISKGLGRTFSGTLSQINPRITE